MQKQEIKRLLKVRGSEQENLFKAARETREKYFGNRAELRAVVETTNMCRGKCHYCAMEKNNGGLTRYKLQPGEIMAATKEAKNAGIGVIMYQSGEAPLTTEQLLLVISKAKEENLIVILCLGNKTYDEYRRLREAGADRYILKFETSDRVLHRWMRGSCLTARLDCLENLMRLGYAIGTGNIVGLPGQTIDSIAEDIMLAKNYNVSMVSAAPFMPASQSRLSAYPAGDLNLTLNTLAVMRLVLPGALIPAVSALEKLEKGGQLRGLNAGANVITVNFTPGVVNTVDSKPVSKQIAYPIYGENRFVVSLEHAKSMAELTGLQFFQ